MNRNVYQKYDRRPARRINSINGDQNVYLPQIPEQNLPQIRSLLHRSESMFAEHADLSSKYGMKQPNEITSRFPFNTNSDTFAKGPQVMLPRPRSPRQFNQSTHSLFPDNDIFSTRPVTMALSLPTTPRLSEPMASFATESVPSFSDEVANLALLPKRSGSVTSFHSDDGSFLESPEPGAPVAVKRTARFASSNEQMYSMTTTSGASTGKTTSITLRTKSLAIFDGDERMFPDGASPSSSLYLTQMGQQRRESFLYKSDSDFDLSAKSISRHSSLCSDSIDASTLSHLQRAGLVPPGHVTSGHEDVIVTPFAQILQTLRTVRNNFMFIAKVPNTKVRRGSTVLQTASAINKDEEGQKLAVQTLEELDWCLDQLETMHTHRSVSDLASTKFRKMLGKELTAFEASGPNSGGNSRVSEFIISTYLDKEQELDLPSPKEGSSNSSSETNMGKVMPQTLNSAESIPNEELLPTYLRELSPRALTKHLSQSNSNLRCPEEIPICGVSTVHESDLMQSLEKIDNWGIDIFRIAELSENRPLTCVTYTIMKNRNLLNIFQISSQSLITYLMRLESHYHPDLPYHNNIHAADVVQSAHVLLKSQPIFNDIEILATLFACAAHDVDHPGVNNQFLVSSEDQLALLYNDESVLENHHISLAFQLLKESGCNVFSNLTAKQWKTVRKMAIDMVLATDMSKHMGLLADLKTMVETKKVAAAYELKLDNYSERIQVLQNLVHCADLSNPTKPLPLYQEWNNRITEELFRQGDREKKLSMPISPGCERPETQEKLKETVARTQVGFITYVIHPLFETWDDLVSSAEIQLTNLEENRDWYQRRFNECLARSSKNSLPVTPSPSSTTLTAKSNNNNNTQEAA